MAKRIFDVLFALFGLILLSPVFLIIALLVKLGSHGPVFYRQERIGRYCQPFLIHKFRSMYMNADKNGLLTVDNDKRITKIGRYLRKTKFDELPQLIDVLIGKMSIVGPRPEVAEFINLYPEDAREIILSVRPGITDYASIQFRHESKMLSEVEDPKRFYIEKILPEKQKLYLRYVNQRTLFQDITIIVRTIYHLIL